LHVYASPTGHDNVRICRWPGTSEVPGFGRQAVDRELVPAGRHVEPIRIVPAERAPDRLRTLAGPHLGQHEPHDDLAVHVEVAGRRKPEPLVKPGRSAVFRYVAGQELRRALGPHEL
jgi:hypothetical protein